MLVMIFVNDLASVRNLPWWTYHMPRERNGMTYVDTVFPAFLFILGLSLPMAIAYRLDRTPNPRRLWLHVLDRSLGLLVLGLALANVEKANAKRTGLSGDVWGLYFLLCAILFWNVNSSRRLKAIGLVGMLVLFAIFRRNTPDGAVRWLDFSYWEILGLIGWTYLAVSILYISTRRFWWAPAAWLALMIVYNIVATAESIDPPFYLWPFGNGAFCVLSLAGVVCGQMIANESKLPAERRIANIAFLGCALLAAGRATQPLGISKIAATPAWALYCAGGGALVFAALYWICDVKHRATWANLVRPAGQNTLLTYLVPDVFYFAAGSHWPPRAMQAGTAGVIRSVLFTAAMAGIAALLTRMRVRLQL